MRRRIRRARQRSARIAGRRLDDQPDVARRDRMPAAEIGGLHDRRRAARQPQHRRGPGRPARDHEVRVPRAESGMDRTPPRSPRAARRRPRTGRRAARNCQRFFFEACERSISCRNSIPAAPLEHAPARRGVDEQVERGHGHLAGDPALAHALGIRAAPAAGRKLRRIDHAHGSLHPVPLTAAVEHARLVQHDRRHHERVVRVRLRELLRRTARGSCPPSPAPSRARAHRRTPAARRTGSPTSPRGPGA